MGPVSSCCPPGMCRVSRRHSRSSLLVPERVRKVTLGTPARACARKLHAILAGRRRRRRRLRRPDGRPDVPAEPRAGHACAAALGRHPALPVDAVVGRPRAAAPAAAPLRREHLPPGAADTRLLRAPLRKRARRRSVPARDGQSRSRPERRSPAVLRPVGSRDLPARAPARNLDRGRFRRRRDLRLRAAALHAPGAAPPRDRPVDSLLSRLRPRLSAAWTKARPSWSQSRSLPCSP